MGKTIAAMMLVVSLNALAGYGGMANVADDGAGGSLGFSGLIAIVFFFGGIFWFMTRFKNEQDGFFYLMGAVLLLIVIAGMSKCSM